MIHDSETFSKLFVTVLPDRVIEIKLNMENSYIENKTKQSSTLVVQTKNPVDLEDLCKYFKKYGSLNEVKRIKRMRKDEIINLCFIYFEERENAIKAFEEKDKILIGNQPAISTEYAIKHPNQKTSPHFKSSTKFSKTRVHVLQKPSGYTIEQLNSYFKEGKAVLPQNTAKDYFFIDFPSERDMLDAIKKYNLTKFEGTDVTIKMTPAQVSSRNKKKFTPRKSEPEIENLRIK